MLMTPKYSACLRLLIFLWLVLASGNSVSAHGDGDRVEDLRLGFSSDSRHGSRCRHGCSRIMGCSTGGSRHLAPANRFSARHGVRAATSLMGFPLPESK